MGWVRFYWGWIKTALSFHRSFYIADAVAGAISIFSPPIILWVVPEPISKDTAKMVESLAWQIPLGVLGVLTFTRILLAPYWMSKQSAIREPTPLEQAVILLTNSQVEVLRTQRLQQTNAPSTPRDQWQAAAMLMNASRSDVRDAFLELTDEYWLVSGINPSADIPTVETYTNVYTTGRIAAIRYLWEQGYIHGIYERSPGQFTCFGSIFADQVRDEYNKMFLQQA